MASKLVGSYVFLALLGIATCVKNDETDQECIKNDHEVPEEIKLKDGEKCWLQGDNQKNIEKRDARCAGALVCARKGHEERNFGCEDHYCCSKEEAAEENDHEVEESWKRMIMKATEVYSPKYVAAHAPALKRLQNILGIWNYGPYEKQFGTYWFPNSYRVLEKKGKIFFEEKDAEDGDLMHGELVRDGVWTWRDGPLGEFQHDWWVSTLTSSTGSIKGHIRLRRGACEPLHRICGVGKKGKYFPIRYMVSQFKKLRDDAWGPETIATDEKEHSPATREWWNRWWWRRTARSTQHGLSNVRKSYSELYHDFIS